MIPLLYDYMRLQSLNMGFDTILNESNYHKNNPIYKIEIDFEELKMAILVILISFFLFLCITICLGNLC